MEHALYRPEIKNILDLVLEWKLKTLKILLKQCKCDHRGGFYNINPIFKRESCKSLRVLQLLISSVRRRSWAAPPKLAISAIAFRSSGWSSSILGLPTVLRKLGAAFEAFSLSLSNFFVTFNLWEARNLRWYSALRSFALSWFFATFKLCFVFSITFLSIPAPKFESLRRSWAFKTYSKSWTLHKALFWAGLS